MRIGEVAQIVGISARSIRHYHRLGVMAEPARTTGGYREYDVADLARIARIAFLSSCGVPLREVAALLEAETGGASTSGSNGGDPAPHEPAADAAADLAAIRDGIDEQIAQLTRQRDRLDVIAQRAAAGLPPGLLPEPVARALETCRAEAAADPELAALLDSERDLLDLVALHGDFPGALAASYGAIGADAGRRRAYLDLLAGFQRIEGRRPADVEPEITRLVDALLSDADLRALVAGPTPAADSPTPSSEPNRPADRTGPTLDQLLPDPAQREVLRRTLTALGVLS
ncbi:MerR family transcriptional regulator [Dietzia aurantiaca]|uniref:MerR family transcriptional regulator n=1 Tax=Dietzia aurantiaca TaxID=983873 RepID=UPI001E328D38|nr:MerR family transcriptional regulator [Dietzia aurantiaca]MCD2262891.1 MerR family transcriptional regulator [Dietzia aurantiaca]